jgi:hypothetical protein
MPDISQNDSPEARQARSDAYFHRDMLLSEPLTNEGFLTGCAIIAAAALERPPEQVIKRTIDLWLNL